MHNLKINSNSIPNIYPSKMECFYNLLKELFKTYSGKIKFSEHIIELCYNAYKTSILIDSRVRLNKHAYIMNYTEWLIENTEEKMLRNVVTIFLPEIVEIELDIPDDEFMMLALKYS